MAEGYRAVARFGKITQGEVGVQRGDHCLRQRTKSVDLPRRIEIRGDFVVILAEPLKHLRRRIYEQRKQVRRPIRGSLSPSEYSISPTRQRSSPASRHRQAVTRGISDACSGHLRKHLDHEDEQKLRLRASRVTSRCSGPTERRRNRSEAWRRP